MNDAIKIALCRELDLTLRCIWSEDYQSLECIAEVPTAMNEIAMRSYTAQITANKSLYGPHEYVRYSLANFTGTGKVDQKQCFIDGGPWSCAWHFADRIVKPRAKRFAFQARRQAGVPLSKHVYFYVNILIENAPRRQ